MGAGFLWFCTAECFRGPRVYARRALAQSGAYRPLFFHSLDGRPKIDVVICGRWNSSVVDLDQSTERVDWRADRIHRTSALQFFGIPARGAMGVCGDHIGSVHRLVLARSSTRRGVLPTSLFWSLCFSNHECKLVLEHRLPNCNLDAHSPALRPGNRRFVCEKID